MVLHTTVTKKFRFDAGHRALNLQHLKEDTLHGHTFTLFVSVETSQNLDDHQIVFDTNILKKIVQPIIDALDHSFILWDKDPMYTHLKRITEEFNIAPKLYLLEYNPTMEGIAKHIYQKISDAVMTLNQKVFISLLRLEVSETLSTTIERSRYEYI